MDSDQTLGSGAIFSWLYGLTLFSSWKPSEFQLHLSCFGEVSKYQKQIQTTMTSCQVLLENAICIQLGACVPTLEFTLMWGLHNGWKPEKTAD